jgi:hypothetical protein
MMIGGFELYAAPPERFFDDRQLRFEVNRFDERTILFGCAP